MCKILGYTLYIHTKNTYKPFVLSCFFFKVLFTLQRTLYIHIYLQICMYSNQMCSDEIRGILKND